MANQTITDPFEARADLFAQLERVDRARDEATAAIAKYGKLNTETILQQTAPGERRVARPTGRQVPVQLARDLSLARKAHARGLTTDERLAELEAEHDAAVVEIGHQAERSRAARQARNAILADLEKLVADHRDEFLAEAAEKVTAYRKACGALAKPIAAVHEAWSDAAMAYAAIRVPLGLDALPECPIPDMDAIGATPPVPRGMDA